MNPASRLEANDAVDARVDGVVAAQAGVVAGLVPRAALTHEDRPRLHCLTSEALDAAELRVGVATVTSGSLSLFM